MYPALSRCSLHVCLNENIATTSDVLYTFRSESFSVVKMCSNPEMANYSDGITWSFLTGLLKGRKLELLCFFVYAAALLKDF